MLDRKHRLRSLALTLALVALNLVALNWLASGWSSARVDLTEERTFSISPATRRLLASLDEELTIYGYFSGRTHPKLAPLVPEIRDLLDEYRAVSRGKVHVEFVDLAEDEEAAQEAADRYGVRSTPFRLASKYESGIVNAYFALVIKYGDQYERYGFQDLIRIDPLPDGDVEVGLRNLEYDLTRAIKKVVYGFRSTNELFERIEQPVKLISILTPSALPEVFAEVPETVRKAAQELETAGGDRFEYEELDPSASPEAAARVEQEIGAPPMSMGLFGEGDFYLYGLLQVGEGKRASLEQLALSDPELTAASLREQVESSLRRRTPGFLKTVGVAAPEPLSLPPQLQFQMQQPPPEFEELKRFLGQDYQVKDVRLDEPRGIPSDVDVLLVVKPANLTPQAVFALDQYLMRGGRVVLCASEYDAQFDMEGLRVAPLETGLDDWLAHFGVRLEKTLVLDDRNQALPIPELRHTPLGTLRTWTMAPYPYLVQVREEGFAHRDITASLDSVGIYWGSPLALDEKPPEGLEVLPILRSSEKSWTDDDLSRTSYVDYEVPAQGLSPQLLAVAVSGEFSSYYADRPAPGAEPAAPDAVEPAAAPRSVTLKKSPPTRLVVVGNAAFVSDLVARTIGQADGGFFVENLRFLENLIDWVAMDNDMLEIRSRGLVSRRLDRTSKQQELGLESAAYLIPVVVLLVAGLNVRARRRRTVPIVAAPAGHGDPIEGVSR